MRKALVRWYRLLADPERLKRRLLVRRKGVPFSLKLEYDAVKRPSYAYGVYHAAVQARSLGLKVISVIEFGVAWGDGLRDLVHIARRVSRETGIEVQVWGFDTGEGMPPAKDYRDLPYVWTTGLFRPRPRQRKRGIRGATMVIGDVGKTVPEFFELHDVAPVGFIAIDVDYYSSTVDVLKLFDAPAERMLPRVLCYVDDCIGDDHEIHCEFVGELLAIREFNESHDQRKIAKIHGLRHKRKIQQPWNDMMFAAHLFDHPQYCTYTNPRWTARSNGHVKTAAKIGA